MVRDERGIVGMATFAVVWIAVTLFILPIIGIIMPHPREVIGFIIPGSPTFLNMEFARGAVVMIVVSLVVAAIITFILIKMIKRGANYARR